MDYNVNELFNSLRNGNIKSLSRCISLVENEANDYEQLLELADYSNKNIIGITGPPGAGKSTLTDALIAEIISNNKKVAVLCVDPSSPFNSGALLGDRIRMNQWYLNPDVYIRSLSTRGSLGGLNPKILEITDLLKAAPFDYIIIETVGVGQSEVEIAELADTTVVVVVPEAGDDIQMMKAGLLEIADIFAVNKSDRPDADRMVQNLERMIAGNGRERKIPVLKTIAFQKQSADELFKAIKDHSQISQDFLLKTELLTKKALYLIRQQRMKDLNYAVLKEKIEKEYKDKRTFFNLYKFIKEKRYE